MIKCNLEACKNHNNGKCILDSIEIDNLDFEGCTIPQCSNFEFSQSYKESRSKSSFKSTLLSDTCLYAIRTSVSTPVDVKYIFGNNPNINSVIVDNLLYYGTKSNQRFFEYTKSNDNVIGQCFSKNNNLITKEMLKFSCDYIRAYSKQGCITSTAYKMILKGFDL